MKISIVIPAYNEEHRIERTLRAYHQFFLEKQQTSVLTFEIVVVLNNCTDNTIDVVEKLLAEIGNTLIILNLLEAGKGLAIRTGFVNALTRDNALIGFVDADMATSPESFFDLITQLGGYDGAIASRYMPESRISPKRPAYKRWGSRLIYEPFVYSLFRLSYYDLQCGAKIFKRAVIEKVTPSLTVKQWAFDAEVLYLCKKFEFNIKEVATTWCDQAGSKLTLRGGLRMFGALFKVWRAHRE